MKMRRRLLPDTLFGRLFAAIVGAVAVTLLVIVALILRERRELAFLGSAAGASASSIVEASEYLASLPRERRSEARNELRSESSGHDGVRPRRPPPPENHAALERAFATRVQKALGDGYRVRAGPPREAHAAVISLEPSLAEPAPGPGPDPGPGPGRRMMDVSVLLPDGDRIVFRVAAPQPGPKLPPQIFVELGVLTVALSLLIFAITRTITRPLAELARAADAVGRGEAASTLRERGSREVRAAMSAFNAMQERLRRYLDSRTRVLAAMSHDLRTPLTRLRLRVESIEDDQLRKRCTADLEEMTNMVRGALGVFRGLNEEAPAAPIDVNALVCELVEQSRELGRDISVEGAAATPYPGSALALKRCLGNLIENALQHAARCVVRVKDGPALVIRVCDNGPGVPETALEQVFEPFFRLELSRNRDTGGTGLGLSIARDVAQAHGGSLTLHNRPEGGLEARLTLPRDGR
jgi:signal transduction histidine kinase